MSSDGLGPFDAASRGDVLGHTCSPGSLHCTICTFAQCAESSEILEEKRLMRGGSQDDRPLETPQYLGILTCSRAQGVLQAGEDDPMQTQCRCSPSKGRGNQHLPPCSSFSAGFCEFRGWPCALTAAAATTIKTRF